MKPVVSTWTLPLCLVFALPAAATPTPVTLLHINDTHGHGVAWGPKDRNLDGTRGGLPRAATVIARERAEAGGNALFVHAGDFFHGDLLFNQYLGVPELMILQELGLDALAVGNHEFQFGPDFLAGVLNATWPSGQGSVPLLGTNLDLTGYPALGAWVTPTLLKDVGGVKVGLFSLTTPFDPLEMPAPVVISEDLAGTAARAVAELRAAGAQVVVCLAHLEHELDLQLASGVPGIDVIVGAHTHETLARPEVIQRPGGGNTYLVFAGSYYGWVGRMRLLVDGSDVHLEDYRLLSVDRHTPELPAVAGTIDALKLGIMATYGDVWHTPLAWAAGDIPNTASPHRRVKDSAVGDLWTDSYRAATHTEVAVEAEGFLDEGLPRGTLVPADILRSMAYGWPVVPEDGSPPYVRPFKLVTFGLTGLELLKGLEIGLATPGGLFLQVSGVRFSYDSSLPPGQRILLKSLRVNGQPIDLGRSYTVTANEGVVAFLPMLGIEATDIVIREETAYEAARALVERRGLITPVTFGRIRDVAGQPGAYLRR